MDSSLLIAGRSRDNAEPHEIVSRDDAWAFIKGYTDAHLKLRIDLQEEDGYDYEYRDGGEIMIDRSVDDMISLYYNWEPQLPGLTDILNVVMADLTDPDMYSDENVIEELMSDIYEVLERINLTGKDLRFTKDMLEELVSDMYNYFGYALTFCKLIKDEKVWEFLRVTKAHMENGKLYITARIYVEGLRDLDYMNERSDVDFVEVADEIRKLFILSNETRARREIHHRDRDRGLVRRLIA